jgi:uncharacterized protein (DUF58 family)
MTAAEVNPEPPPEDLAASAHSRTGWRAVTTRGRTTAAIAAAAAVLGGVTGWREWTAIAAALAVLLVAAAVMALGRSSAAVELDLPRTRFVVGEPGAATVLVRNTSNRRMWPLRMELEVGGEPLIVPVPALRGGGTHLVSIVLPTDRRAVLDVGPLRAVRGDVFGLIRRVVQWPVRRQVFVHPRTVRPNSSLPGFVRDLEGEESTKRTASDLSFHTLREYVPGDDRRFIHWKSTARNGTLQVKEFLQTHRSLVAVVLSGSSADYHRATADGAAMRDVGDEFEVAVSCAASIVAELVRRRRDVVTAAAGAVIGAPTADGVLDQFSAVDAVGDAPDLIFQTKAAARRYPRASLMVLVFGSAVTSAQVRAAVRTCPAGASELAVRARTQSSPYPARLTGSEVYRVLTVPDVDALPNALRAAG